MAYRSISINWPAKFFINKGVKIGAIMVATEVKVSESATLALAKYDMTLDAKPQGIQATKIIPAEISGGKVKIFVMDQPTKGMIEKWKNTPSATAFGDLKTS